MSGKVAKRRRQSERAEIARTMPVVVQFIRGAVDTLRGEYARRLKAIRQNDPKGAAELGGALTPCTTCAFRKTADFTDGDDAFLKTSCSLVAALASDHPFLCHHPKEPGETGDYRPREFPCIGWLTLQSPIPGTFNVRKLLGDRVVDLCVDGNNVFNEAKP